MTKILGLGLALCGVAVLGACSSSVDRDGSRDNIVKELEQFGTVDDDCVGDVLDKYTDEELLGFSDEVKDAGAEGTVSDEASAYQFELLACVTTPSS